MQNNYSVVGGAMFIFFFEFVLTHLNRRVVKYYALSFNTQIVHVICYYYYFFIFYCIPFLHTSQLGAWHQEAYVEISLSKI